MRPPWWSTTTPLSNNTSAMSVLLLRAAQWRRLISFLSTEHHTRDNILAWPGLHTCVGTDPLLQQLVKPLPGSVLDSFSDVQLGEVNLVLLRLLVLTEQRHWLILTDLRDGHFIPR